MTTKDPAVDGAWVPLAEAAMLLGVSTDTVRRRMKLGELEHRLAGRRFLIHVSQESINAAPRSAKTLTIVEDIHPSMKAALKYMRERDAIRDRELQELHEELARARADLVAIYAAMPTGQAWSPFEWFRQLWVSQLRHIRPATLSQTT